MARVARTAADEADSLSARRQQFFSRVTLGTAGVAALSLLLLALLGGFSGDADIASLVPIAAAAAAVALFSFWLYRRGWVAWGIGVFLAGVTAGITAVLVTAIGPLGPPIIVLICIPIVASLVGGRRLGYAWAIVVGALYVTLLILDGTGVLILPATPTGRAIKVQSAVNFVAMLALIVYAVGMFIQQAETGLAAAAQRRNELEQVTREAEAAAAAERQMREREVRTVRQQRQAVRRFIAFLQQVSSGDYQARLDVEEMVWAGSSMEGQRDLADLATYLNATVDSLVSALRDMETIQRRYVSEAWSEFAEDNPELLSHDLLEQGQETAIGDARGPTDVRLEEGWRSLADRSLRSGRPEVDGQLLALPIVWSDQAIGVIGARRKSAAAWTGQEMALARAVVDQLAQTMENLRLVDQTQRSAQRERMMGQISSSIRQELDLDGMLRTTVDEIQQVLGLERVVIRLAKRS